MTTWRPPDGRQARPALRRMTSVADILAPSVRWYVRHVPGTFAKELLVDRMLDQGLQRRPRRYVARTRLDTHFSGTTSDLIQRYIYAFGVWEPNLTHWLCRRLADGDVFVDIGANAGYFTLLASRLVGPSGSVLAVEPSPRSFAMLQANLAINDCANVRALNVAMSDSPGRLRMYQTRPDNLGSTTAVRLSEAPHWEFEAEARTLPDVLSDTELRRARVIKIDVEGAEHAVLRGLMPALASMRQDLELVVEVDPDLVARQARSVDEMMRPLAVQGFKVYRLANDYCPSSYVSWPRHVAPVRWPHRIEEKNDLVFSRVDAEQL